MKKSKVLILLILLSVIFITGCPGEPSTEDTVYKNNKINEFLDKEFKILRVGESRYYKPMVIEDSFGNRHLLDRCGLSQDILIEGDRIKFSRKDSNYDQLECSLVAEILK